MAKYNENKLSVIYDKRKSDFIVKYPRRADGALALSTLVGDNLRWLMPTEAREKKKCYPFNF